MENQHCGAAPAAASGHCEDHSGQMVYMRGITTLLVISAGLLAYSVFWQAPAIRTDIVKEFGRVDGEIKLVQQDVKRHSEDITDLRGRVNALEERTHAP